MGSGEGDADAHAPGGKLQRPDPYFVSRVVLTGVDEVRFDNSPVAAHERPVGIDPLTVIQLDEWIGAGGPVLGIKPQDLTTFMNSGANRTDYMIIDLRTDQGMAGSFENRVYALIKCLM